MGCDHLLHSRKKTDRCGVCDGKGDSCIYKISKFTEKIASKSTVAHSATEELVVFLWLNTCTSFIPLFPDNTFLTNAFWAFVNISRCAYHLGTVNMLTCSPLNFQWTFRKGLGVNVVSDCTSEVSRLTNSDSTKTETCMCVRDRAKQ